MRGCPYCSQLIHDAAVVCRFCRESVPQVLSVEPEWEDFTSRFYRVSDGKRWDLWNTLPAEKRTYAQKILGMAPPDRVAPTYTGGAVVKATPAQTPVDVVGSQLRRLLTGYLLLSVMTLAFAACVMVFQVVEVPSLASQKLLLSAPGISGDLDQGLAMAVEKLTGSGRGVGDAAMKSFSRSSSALQKNTSTKP